MKSLIGTDMADYICALSVSLRTESVCIYYWLPVFHGIACVWMSLLS